MTVVDSTPTPESQTAPTPGTNVPPAVEPADQLDDVAAETTEPAEETTPNREAAKYRKQLRDTEADRDTIRDQLTASRRALAEQLLQGGVDIAGKTMRPTVVADVFDIGGTTVADLLNEQGQLDFGKLTEAVTALHATRPGLFEQLSQAHGAYVPTEGRNPGPGTSTATWAAALGRR